MIDLAMFSVRAADGSTVPLGDHAGRVTLIVNVASKCGFTPQYAGLEALYRQYRDRGLAVLGFPCDQFGGQEPGDAAAIAAFCATTYDVTFPVFAKIAVNGPDADPLYDALKAVAPGVLGSRAVKWNFTKFVVGPDGGVRRHAPTTKPEALADEIAALL